MGTDIAGSWNIARVGDSVVCTNTDNPGESLIYSVDFARRFGWALVQMSQDDAVDQLDRLLND